MFYVNTPMMFRGVWAILKNFLDEKTRAKIQILGTNFLPTLLEVIDADNIPKFLGGNCTCEDTTGNCMTSNKGPWNDFELVKPKGIKRKQI